MYENPTTRKKYLNIGDLKENIRKLKMGNKLKSKEVIERFYKPQKKATIEREETNTNDENLHKTLSTFYLTMKSDPINFYRNHTSRSLSKFTETHGNGFSTLSARSSKKDIETNLQPLIGLYNMYDETKCGTFCDKKEKKEILKNFNIDAHLDENEKKFLDKNLRTKSGFFNNNFDKTQCSAITYYFENPEKSLKKLKLNRIIFNSIMNLRTSQQLKSYSARAEKEYDRFTKVSQMPKIKENAKKPTNLELLENSTIDVDDLQSSNRLWTRKQYLESDIQYELSYFGENYNGRPGTRSLFSLTLVDNVMYMFAGLKNQKLNEIWKCEIRSKFLT
jgi:hypothetical protein